MAAQCSSRFRELTPWQYTTWDGNRTYNLTFWLTDDDTYDGDLLLECDGADGFVLGQWQGWWRVETALNQPTRLWLELTWIGGSNQTEFAAAPALSESCLVVISPSGEELLLVAENRHKSPLRRVNYPAEGAFL